MSKTSSPPAGYQAVDINKSPQLFISISGLIGAGKTTLCNALGKQMGLPVFHEPVKDNVYLEDFYTDPAKFGFPMQIYLLNARFQQHQQIIWTGEGGVQDRTIYEDSVFAKMLNQAGLMDDRDYETYLSLFAHMSNFMKKPNLIVHLDVSPEVSYARVHKRGRECECGEGSALSLEYLQGLHAAYQEFLAEISKTIPVIRVKWDEFVDADQMAAMIKSEWDAMHHIRTVDFTAAPGSPHAPTSAKPGVDAIVDDLAKMDVKEAPADVQTA